MSRPSILLVTLVLLAASTSTAQELPTSWADGTHWRSIGPSTMGGRIISLAVYENEPSTWWAGTASGGLLKTTNNGITFEHQFDHESTVSVGSVCVSQSNKDIVWVGTGEGNPRNSVSYGDGVYKSTDGGKTWTNMGLRQSFQTGQIVIHPTNPDIVYVGALGRLYGPNEQRGLYKTTDGGKTWNKSHYIDDMTGVIDIDMHPTDPDTLLMATYERERDGFDTNDPSKKYGPGSGIWKTTNGGKTWERMTKGLPTCDFGRVGIDWYRKDPNVVMAIVESEMIAKQPEDAPFLGLRVEAVDAGVKVTGFGAPQGRRRGRGGSGDAEKPKDTPAKTSGLKVGDVVLSIGEHRVHSSDDVDKQCHSHKAGDTVPFNVVRDKKDVVVEVTLGKWPKGARSPFTGTLGGQAANMQDRQGPNGHEYGGVYKSTDAGETWTRVNTLNPRPMYYSQIRVDPTNADNIMVLGTSLYRSTNGGEKFERNAGRGVHSDHHAEWINPNNGDHIIHGSDGGIYVTYDACKNWDHLNHTAIGQFYHVGCSQERNYWVFGGLQDNGSWGAPSRTAGTGQRNHDWIRIGGGDGFRCLVDPENPNIVYSQSQNGPPSWRDLETGARGSLRARGGRGSGDSNTPRVRFNWETPYLISDHNNKIVYTAGSVVMKSLNRGVGMKHISPEITNTERGAATALAESPKDANIVYVGTDDGALWVTRDGGVNWVDCFKVGVPSADAGETVSGKPVAVKDGEKPAGATDKKPAGATDKKPAGATDEKPAGAPIAAIVPGPRWVSELVASKYDAKRAYVTLDGHRSDDDAPYALMTNDAGDTWHSLTGSLPEGAGSTRTIAEDPVNEDVLYLGTEFSAYVSINRGKHWTRLNGNMPTVAVHAFAINVPSGEVVAGTHGRSLWITNVNAVRQMTEKVMAKGVHFYKPVSAVIWKSGTSTGGTNRRFVGENPATGATLTYHLKKKATSAKIEIVDGTAKVIRTIEVSTDAGLHNATWDLRGAPPASNNNAGGRGGRGGRSGRGGGRRVRPGTFGARLIVDGETQSHSLTVEIDPEHPDPSWITLQEEAERLEAELGGDEEHDG